MKVKDLTENQQEIFTEAFYAEWPADYDDDTESPTPWGCPWIYNEDLEVGDDIAASAKSYYKVCEPEILEHLEEEYR